MSSIGKASSFWMLSGKSPSPCHFSASSGHLYSLACGFFLLLRNALLEISASIFTLTFTLSLPLPLPSSSPHPSSSPRPTLSPGPSLSIALLRPSPPAGVRPSEPAGTAGPPGEGLSRCPDISRQGCAHLGAFHLRFCSTSQTVIKARLGAGQGISQHGLFAYLPY